MDTLQIPIPPPSAEPERRGPPPHYQLWSPKCLLWIGILTSFLFSGVMQGINYGRLGQLRRRKMWLARSILGFAVFEILLWVVPDFYVPLIACLVVNTTVAVFVGLKGVHEFRAHESSGGRRAPVGMPIACVTASCLVLFAILGTSTVIGYATDDSRLENAIADLDEGAYESAKPEFQRFIQKYPDEIDGYWNLTTLHENSGELELAIECLEKGIKHCSEADDAESYLISLRTTFATEQKQLAELSGLVEELTTESETSRAAAYETIDRLSDEGISVRMALELIKLSGKNYPQLTEHPKSGPQVRLIDLAAQQYSPLSVPAIRETFDLWTRHAKSAGLDFLATIETHDAATLFVELVRQCAAMEQPPELRTGDYDEIPRYVDVLFPALLEYTANPAFRWQIWALCKSMCEAGYAADMGTEKLSAALMGDFREQLATVRAFQESDDTDWMHDSAYFAERDSAILLLDIMEFQPFDNVRGALYETIESPDPRLRCYAVLSLLGHREKIRQPIIDTIADHPATRGLLYKELRSRTRLDLYPDRHESQMALAESDLVHWLSYPSELGRPPDEIQLMDTFTVDDEGMGPAEYFLFRFRVSAPHWAAKDGWMAGIAGPFERAGGPTADGGGNTFSRFETWESKTPIEHFQSAINVLDEWRRKGH